jgi:putative hemolysin
MLERYGLNIDIKSGALSNIPLSGPVVLVANHPYGILDGLIMSYILARQRGDFRILAHHVFSKAKELKNIIIPISFDESKEAVQHNLRSRKMALDYLKAGGVIGVFPGGTVSTSLTPFSRPMDPSWRSFTARMITKSNATVIPIYFEGHTSRLFQIASHLHYTLRMGLLINEFRQRVDGPVSISIGNPIEPAEILQRSKDARVLMQFLRQKTYDLAERPIDPFEHGFEFDQRYKAV